VVRDGLALGSLLLMLAVGVGLTVPGGLSSPGEAALSAVRGGTCSWPYYVDCSNNSVCVSQGTWSIYYHYTGLGLHPFDPATDYDVGWCRYLTNHINSTNCSTAPGAPYAIWYICS
jgi:hypothetical protein